MELLKRDEIWEIFGIESQEEFLNKFVPNFILHQNTNADVKMEYGEIEKLVKSSYQNYKFIDHAVSKAFMVYEMALHLRYEEIYGKKWKKDFKSLIDKLCNDNIFEVSKELLHKMRKIRNGYAHLREHSFGGVAMFHWFRLHVMIINECYEDLNLRKKRIMHIDFVNSLLDENRPIAIQIKDSIFLPARLCCVYFSSEVYVFAVVWMKDYNSNDTFDAEISFIYVDNINVERSGVIEGRLIDKKDKIKIALYNSDDKYLESTWRDWKKDFDLLEKRHQISFLVNSNIDKRLVDIKNKDLTDRLKPDFYRENLKFLKLIEKCA